MSKQILQMHATPVAVFLTEAKNIGIEDEGNQHWDLDHVATATESRKYFVMDIELKRTYKSREKKQSLLHV